MQSLEEKTIIALARQGDAEAIAQMLNYYFKAHQISVTAHWQGHDLTVVLAGQQVPDRARVISPIRYVFKKLALPHLTQVHIYGRQQGRAGVAWQETLTNRREQRTATNLPAVDLPVMNSPMMDSPTGNSPAIETWLNQGAQTPSPSFDPWPHLPIIAQRLLRFELVNGQTALISMDEIREVFQIAPADILPIPQMPDCMVGVCNYRGGVLWLIDCNQQLGLPSTLINGEAAALMVVVAEQDDRRLGLVIPRIVGIETYREDEILPADGERFSPSLRPLLKGCLANSTAPVLSAAALMQDRQLQMH